MPQRYNGGRISPFVHSNIFDIFVGLVCLTYGLFAIFNAEAIPKSIEALPELAEILYRVVMTSAGFLILLGLGRGPHRWSFGVEITGMIFAATVFATYAVGLITMDGPLAPRLLATVIFCIITVCCLVRASGLNLESRNRLIQLQSLVRTVTEEK